MCRNPPRHLSQLKALAIPLTLILSGKELLRFLICFHGLFIGSSKSKNQSSIAGQVKAYFGGSKWERVIAQALLEVMSPEVALTGNDVTWSQVTGSDVIAGVMFCTCPEVHSRAFFLTIVVVRNVPLRMTGSSMVNGYDMTGSHVTGSNDKEVMSFSCAFFLP